MNRDFLAYNALDAACTLEIRNAIWEDLHSTGYDTTYQLTVDLFEPLMFLQTRGIKVSMAALVKTREEIIEQAQLKQQELNQLCGREINVNSSKQMQEYFYVELGIPPYYNDGKVTVDDLALQRLSRGTARRPGLRQAKLVQEIRGLEKLHGTYYNLEFDSDGRFRSSYNPRGTKFGRLSSSKTIFGTGSNAQNLPQEFKKFLEADEGYVLWEVDKRQAEWVVVAYLADDPNMMKVIREGKDTHIHTASLMFNMEAELLQQEDKLVGYNTDPAVIEEIRLQMGLGTLATKLPRTMSGRQCGKKSNHGLNYDEGYTKFALINEMEQSEAKRIVELYHLIYPGIRGIWYPSIQRQLQKDRTLTNCFGRKVRFMDQWGSDLFKAAYSMMPQSTVVDSLNKGMISIYRDDTICGISEANIDLLAQGHDAILMQVPISIALDPKFQEIWDTAYRYVSPDITYHGRTFQIATDSKFGFNWGGYNEKLNPKGMREVKDMESLRQLIERHGRSTSQ